MANKIQLRRDTASVWTAINPVLAEGEIGIETDTRYLKFGDGTTAWTGLGYVLGGPTSAPSPSPSPSPAPPPSSTDTRARWFLAPADAYNTGTQAYLSGSTPLTGSSNGSVAGNFSLTTTPGTFGWLAVLASASTSGIHVNDGIGFGGWSGAGLAGNNGGASPDPSVSAVTFTDANGTVWRLFRQDYIHANPSAGTYTVTAV